MMKDPLATVPKWYRISLRMEEKIGVTGRRFLSLKQTEQFNFSWTVCIHSVYCVYTTEQVWVQVYNSRSWHCFIQQEILPGEVVCNHSSSHSHVLTSQDELCDPNQTYSMEPGQVLKGSNQSELCYTRVWILNWFTWSQREMGQQISTSIFPVCDLCDIVL